MQSLEGTKVIYLTKIYTVHNVHNVYHVYWIVVTHCWLYYLKRYFSTCNVTSHRKCIKTQKKPCTILVKMSRSAFRNLYLLNFSLKSMGNNHAQCTSVLSPWLSAVTLTQLCHLDSELSRTAFRGGLNRQTDPTKKVANLFYFSCEKNLTNRSSTLF